MKYSFEEIIGNNITKYRTQIGMTQAELAEEVGVSPAFISRVERGKKMMKVQTLYAVAQALKVSCDALLCQESNSVPFENIRVLFSSQSDVFLRSIESLIRVCIKEFGQ